jgi:hypothetical protein
LTNTRSVVETLPYPILNILSDLESKSADCPFY